MGKTVRIAEETWNLPTYLLGDSEYLPLFLERRAYQGSSGKVYPYRVYDQIQDKKELREYQLIVLENDYLKVAVLPEIGGRIQMAYDKIRQRHFVYYNQVIKPALVGLTGPWISGGIEFNWPQHHRPSTYEPLEYQLEENTQSVAVYLGELERMNGLQQCLCIRLYADKSYIELNGRIFNTSPLPQTFLWWANPAVKASGGHQSIFPPDVTAVYDHGKRDVSRFPIATGKYYKADYSAGVDLSRYENIPVPTSYMAWRSEYDFVGAYVHAEEGGLLHVGNHHIAPGKKQWTWGNGDFGRVWDRNLTDEDGPYIELMTGVYTDNQPDFTWLDPYEEKQFTQYFMPYHKLGSIQNASKRIALKCELTNPEQNKENLELGLLSFGTESDLEMELWLLSPTGIEAQNAKLLFQKKLTLHPEDCWTKTLGWEELEIPDPESQNILYYAVYNSERELLLDYQCNCHIQNTPNTSSSILGAQNTVTSKEPLHKIPEPATSPLPPEQVRHIDELFFIGQHIEQYRNPALDAESYYTEMLRRDPSDYRANLAMGRLSLRAFAYQEALPYLDQALQRQTSRNTNPADGEASYLNGLCLLWLDRNSEAFASFYKSTWSQNYKASSLYYISVIHCQAKRYLEALSCVEQAVTEQGKNWQALCLQAYLLRRLGRCQEAREQIDQVLRVQPLHMTAMLESTLLQNEESNNEEISDTWCAALRSDAHNLMATAHVYSFWGNFSLASQIMAKIPSNNDPMQYYNQAYLEDLQDKPFALALEAAESCRNFRHFPNKAEDYRALQFAANQKECRMAHYHLGNLLYDRKRYDEAFACWKKLPSYAPALRNCSIYLHNKQGKPAEALKYIEQALALDGDTPRMVFEYGFLLQVVGKPASECLRLLERFAHLLSNRDDLFLMKLQCQLLQQEYASVLEQISKHTFHPWEGGEGKVGRCFISASIGQALTEYQQKNYVRAIDILQNSLKYPENLNEGKLIGQTDNDIYYFLGCIQSAAGQEEAARTSWRRACLGDSEISVTSYYNDRPLDYLLYQALAHRKLDEHVLANQLCYLLLDFGERNLGKKPQLDFFAVSMPDFTVYEIDCAKEFRERCLFSLYLGFTALGNQEQADSFQTKLLRENSNHLGLNLLSNIIIYTK